MIALLLTGLHAALMLAAAPVLAGVLIRLRARLAGQVGPPWQQPWHDLRRLARKPPILPAGASPALAAAPLAAAGAAAVAALLVPSFSLGMATAPAADLIAAAGLLALSRAASAVAGLDAGAALGGLAAGRIMATAVLTEAALLLAVFPTAALAGSTNLDLVATAVREARPGVAPLALSLAAATLAAMADAERLQPGSSAMAPMADAAGLSYSGWHLAVWTYAGWLRALVWLTLLATVFAPAGIAGAGAGAGPGAWCVGLLAWALKLAVGAAALVAWHAMRPQRAAGLRVVLGLALLLGLLAAMLLFAAQGSA